MEKVEFIIGKMIEYTEDDRREIAQLTRRLLRAVDQSEPGVAQLILRLFKITQGAIARSGEAIKAWDGKSASSVAEREEDRSEAPRIQLGPSLSSTIADRRRE